MTLKWHGGKHYLASRIIALMPPRNTWLHYVEPYFGGGSVEIEIDNKASSSKVKERRVECVWMNY